MIRAAAIHPDTIRAFDELSGALFVMLDARGCIDHVNARMSELLGAKEADLLGRDFVDVAVTPTQRSHARAAHTTVSKLSEHATHSFEFELQNAGGLRRLVSWRCMARFDAAGQPIGQVCCGEDITDRRRNEDLVRRSHELSYATRAGTMGELAAGLAHEINQPLAAIVNYARACEHFLVRPAPDVADLREAVREIGVEALRAGDIVRRLRQLVRGEARAHILTGTPELFEELRLLSAADGRAFGTEIEFVAGALAPAVNIDRDQMVHALLNLIRNAFESVSGDPPGTRRVVVEQVLRKDSVEIRVSDNGPGVQPGILDRMFDPFCTTKAARAGLGLPMSRTIVQAHRGRLSFEPAQPRGACFTVELPVADAETT
ncbi:MAG: ATP-binding protein [Pseudomonadota bacterium]